MSHFANMRGAEFEEQGKSTNLPCQVFLDLVFIGTLLASDVGGLSALEYHCQVHSYMQAQS